METVEDIEITKVYKGPSGASQYGDWQIYNFYAKGDPDAKDKRFTYFATEKTKWTPAQGVKIKTMDFEYELKDGYDNYLVKDIKLAKQQTEQGIENMTGNSHQKSSQPQNQTISDRDISFYVSYAKDLMVAAMPLNEDYGMRNVEDLGDIVVRVGKNMMRLANEKGKPNTEPITMPSQEEFSDGTPIGEPPEWAR